MPFSHDFVWGAAAASYQIEGAAYDDGKGLSVWDIFCQNEGTVYKGHTGDVACDHYHRYAEDVALMKEIGLKAYRFSISWPRVFPEGRGAVNEKGLAFYDRLVDELLGAGIQPYVTLFHWDEPWELYCRGSWLSPESPDWFAEYTKVIVDRLSDRVTTWMTFNEPTVFLGCGHRIGVHAPGDKRGDAEILRMTRNVLLAHGKSVQVIRADAKSIPVVGMAPTAAVAIPEKEEPADIEAARRLMFESPGQISWENGMWLDPVYLGTMPEQCIQTYGAAMPSYTEEDVKTIHQPLDFFGFNIYHGRVVRAGKDGNPEVVEPGLNQSLTALRWNVTPRVLYWGPKFFHDRYKLPILITENGLSNQDWVALDGGVHDATRIDFLNRYLLEYERAGNDGVPLKGYMQWSIMDNFEWAEGYKERFGLIFIDYETQKRTLKDSALWYKQVIATKGESLHMT